MASSFLMDLDPEAPRCIVTIGEIVVEIMAETQGIGFLEPMALKGPYPSGAPAIFIDQAAKLGVDCGVISAVGHDDFGTLNVERLKHDGVDISAILRLTPMPPVVLSCATVRMEAGILSIISGNRPARR